MAPQPGTRGLIMIEVALTATLRRDERTLEQKLETLRFTIGYRCQLAGAEIERLALAIAKAYGDGSPGPQRLDLEARLSAEVARREVTVCELLSRFARRPVGLEAGRQVIAGLSAFMAECRSAALAYARHPERDDGQRRRFARANSADDEYAAVLAGVVGPDTLGDLE